MIRQKNFFESTTFKLIILNVFAFLLFKILDVTGIYDFDTLVLNLALQPLSIISGEKLWTLLTSMFLHIQVWHLAANMISLYFVGGFAEKLVGKQDVITIIGPASVVKDIKKDPKKLN